MLMHAADMYVVKDYLKTISKKGVLAIWALLTFLPVACRTQGGVSGEDERFQPASDSDEFHADNDIAMTIRSIVDAIKVGEPLDSTLYDFEGILTDGQGTPLYTDIQGSPGLWEIDVIDNRNVILRNLYLGDLLPSDLQSYLLQSLKLGHMQPYTLTDTLCSFTDHNNPLLYELKKSGTQEKEEEEMTIYDFGGGYLCFEVKSGMAPNGLEGPLLNIVMTADHPYPSGVERQTIE